MKKYKVILYITLLIVMQACAELFDTPIHKINQDPQKYNQKEVTVHGTVREINNLFVKGYILADDNEEIFVTTKKQLPEVNEKVRIKGKVNLLLKIGNEQIITIEEL